MSRTLIVGKQTQTVVHYPHIAFYQYTKFQIDLCNICMPPLAVKTCSYSMFNFIILCSITLTSAEKPKVVHDSFSVYQVSPKNQNDFGKTYAPT